MATTGTIYGGDTILSIDGTALAHSNSCALNLGQDFSEFSSKSGGRWRRFKPGKKGVLTFTAEGMVAYSDSANFSDIFAAYKDGTAVEIRMAGLSGDKYYMGDACYVETLVQTAADEGEITFNATFRVDGEVTEKTLT